MDLSASRPRSDASLFQDLRDSLEISVTAQRGALLLVHLYAVGYERPERRHPWTFPPIRFPAFHYPPGDFTVGKARVSGDQPIDRVLGVDTPVPRLPFLLALLPVFAPGVDGVTRIAWRLFDRRIAGRSFDGRRGGSAGGRSKQGYEEAAEQDRARIGEQLPAAVVGLPPRRDSPYAQIGANDLNPVDQSPERVFVPATKENP